MKKYLLIAIIIFSSFGISAQPCVRTIAQSAIGKEQNTSEPDSIVVEEIIVEEVAIDSIATDSDALTPGEIEAAVDGIDKNYGGQWLDLSMQGKLHMEGLPLKPTVKIYMKRGESVIMSVRASIFGEVARIEMNSDSLTIVNKHSRRYWTQKFNFNKDSVNVIDDLQDLLLGKVAYPGFGRLSAELADRSRWSYEDDDIFLWPDSDIQYPMMEYGYIINDANYQLRVFILHLIKGDIWISSSYDYGEAGWTLGISAEVKGKETGASIELSYPDFAPMPLDFTNIGSKYTPSDFFGVLKF